MLTIDDRLDIMTTLALHGHVVDANELGRLDELFTPDAVYDMTAAGMPAFDGVEAIRTAASRMFASGQAPAAHHVTDVVITGSDDQTATVVSKGLMIMADGGVLGVRHDDVLRRHQGGWRISRRVITPVRTGATDA